MSDCCASSKLLSAINISDYNKELWQNARQPLSATFELTPKCNFNCIHCYLGKHRTIEKELTTAEIKHILDQLSDAGLLFITFTGGECLLRTDFEEIYMYAKRLGFLICIFTNGYTLTDQHFSLFSIYAPFFIDVSVYGGSEATYYTITGIHDGFRRVIQNLNKLKELGISFGIKTPLFKQNINDYDEMVDIAHRLDVKYRFSFALSPTIDKESYPTQYMVPPDMMIRLEAADPVYREMGENYATVENLWGKLYDTGHFVPVFICNPGVNDLFIDFHGNAMPCASYRSEAVSMLTRPFSEIWELFAKYKRIPASAANKCMRCVCRYYCRICPADQEQYYGALESVNPAVCAHAFARKQLFRDHVPLETVILELLTKAKAGTR